MVDGATDSSSVPIDGGSEDATPDALDGAMADSGSADTPPADTGPADTGRPCIVAEQVCNAREDDCDGMIDEAGCGACRRSAFGGRIYLACDVRLDHSAARADCASRSYELVVIDDAGENEHLRLEALPFGRDFWIGMDDRMTEATYRWIDGRVVRDSDTDRLYTNWEPSRPDDVDGWDCIEMDPSNGGWNDVPCDELKPIICEARPTGLAVSP